MTVPFIAEMKIAYETFTYSKSTTETPKKVRNMFEVKNEDNHSH